MRKSAFRSDNRAWLSYRRQRNTHVVPERSRNRSRRRPMKETRIVSPSALMESAPQNVQVSLRGAFTAESNEGVSALGTGIVGSARTFSETLPGNYYPHRHLRYGRKFFHT